MTDSILDTVKKSLGLDPDYTAFDPDIILHINSVFSTLTQLGVGPSTGFVITDAFSSWSDFLGETSEFEFVKSYIHLKVKLIFDPPSTSFAIASMEKMTSEFEWRISVLVEWKKYAAPIAVESEEY